LGVFHGDAVSFTIALDNRGVINGNVGGLLFEIEHRIPLGRHHSTDEAVRLYQGLIRIIDKAPFQFAPVVQKVLAFRTT